MWGIRLNDFSGIDIIVIIPIDIVVILFFPGIKSRIRAIFIGINMTRRINSNAAR